MALSLSGTGGLVAVGGIAAAAGSAPAAALPASAPRDSVGAANARVKQILAKVHALAQQVKAAEARYGAALQAVANGVNNAISADRDRTAVRQLVQTSQQQLQRQILALYSSGGSFATTASLLAPNGLQTFQTSTHALGAAVAETRRLENQQQQLAAAAGRQVSRSSHRAHQSIVTEHAVAGVAAKVQRLLAEQQSLLAQAQRDLANQKALAAQRAALAAETASFASTTTSGVNAVGVLPPSPAYLALYKHAATTCPGLSWTVLAAIGQVESGHGRNMGPSSAGALGPMQFEPATFATYAVDGDHDGQVNIMDPADAIFTAARYLCANGAGRGGQATANAIFDYNHAGWYVQLVLGLAQKYVATYG